MIQSPETLFNNSLCFSMWTEIFYFKLISKLCNSVNNPDDFCCRQQDYYKELPVFCSQDRFPLRVLTLEASWHTWKWSSERGVLLKRSADTDQQHNLSQPGNNVWSPDRRTARARTFPWRLDSCTFHWHTHTHTHTFLVSCMWCFCRGDKLHVALMWRPEGERHVPHWLP